MTTKASKRRSPEKVSKKKPSAKKVSRKKGYLIFISHSQKDRWIARQMSEMLERKGRHCKIKVFLDERSIEGGDSIPNSIRENIKACDEFLVLLSPYSIKSQWVSAEIGAAWQLDKLIVAITDKIIKQEIPEIIGSYKALELNDFDKEYLEQVLKRAKEVKR